jgi:hypothetical protein
LERIARLLECERRLEKEQGVLVQSSRKASSPTSTAATPAWASHGSSVRTATGNTCPRSPARSGHPPVVCASGPLARAAALSSGHHCHLNMFANAIPPHFGHGETCASPRQTRVPHFSHAKAVCINQPSSSSLVPAKDPPGARANRAHPQIAHLPASAYRFQLCFPLRNGHIFPSYLALCVVGARFATFISTESAHFYSLARFPLSRLLLDSAFVAPPVQFCHALPS